MRRRSNAWHAWNSKMNEAYHANIQHEFEGSDQNNGNSEHSELQRNSVLLYKRARPKAQKRCNKRGGGGGSEEDGTSPLCFGCMFRLLNPALRLPRRGQQGRQLILHGDHPKMNESERGERKERKKERQTEIVPCVRWKVPTEKSALWTFKKCLA